MRYPLGALRLQFDDPPPELTFDNARRFGLNPEDLVADDHTPCRTLAQTFRASGPNAFIAPSAALPGTKNLVVLEPHVLVPWNEIPIDEIDWPGSVMSQHGRCPEGLWDLVHYRETGRKHAGFKAWEHGTDMVFEEPPITTASLAA
jgi:hypothetical protein